MGVDMTQFSQKSALVVDDDSVLRDTISFMLRRMGFQSVEIAGDVDSAFAVLQKRDFDLLITDWNMDPLNGLDLLTMVRADQRLKEMPVVMMTANMSEDYWVQAIRAGATDFLQKPFALNSLKETVALALELDISTNEQNAATHNVVPMVS